MNQGVLGLPQRDRGKRPGGGLRATAQGRAKASTVPVLAGSGLGLRRQQWTGMKELSADDKVQMLRGCQLQPGKRLCSRGLSAYLHGWGSKLARTGGGGDLNFPNKDGCTQVELLRRPVVSSF